MKTKKRSKTYLVCEITFGKPDRPSKPLEGRNSRSRIFPIDVTILSFVALIPAQNRPGFYDRMKKYLNPLGRQLARKHLFMGSSQPRLADHSTLTGRHRQQKSGNAESLGVNGRE